MLRKLYSLGLVVGLLAAGPGARLAVAQAGAAAPQAAGTPLSAANSAAEATIWYQTAAYIFQDDPELKPIADKLTAKLNKSSVDGFRRSLEDAVKAEGKPLKDSHVFTFQSTFKEIQAQPPASPAALVAAIQASKLGTKRKEEASFQALMQRLSPAAGTAAAPVAAAATPAADNPMNELGPAPTATAVAPAPVVAPAALPAPAPTPLLLWVALGLAALGLAGVATLLNKLSNTRKDLETLRRVVDVSSTKPSANERLSPKITAAIKEEITQQMNQRVADKQAKTPAPTAAAPAPVAPAPPSAPVAAPAPRIRTQYVGEAPFNNSFAARSLSDQLGAYSMFAIESSEQQPDQGTFAVTGNLASHVRDHRSVLEPVCEYVGGYPLGSETRVVTEQPGLVQRRGNDWEITQRAKVRFE